MLLSRSRSFSRFVLFTANTAKLCVYERDARMSVHTNEILIKHDNCTKVRRCELCWSVMFLLMFFLPSCVFIDFSSVFTFFGSFCLVLFHHNCFNMFSSKAEEDCWFCIIHHQIMTSMCELWCAGLCIQLLWTTASFWRCLECRTQR